MDTLNNTTAPLRFHVPFTFKHTYRLQNTASVSEARRRKITPLQKALIRGHHWLNMLETRQASTIKEVAQRNKVNERYVSRIMNLTTLAPDIITDILDDKLPHHISVHTLVTNTPRLWAEQRKRFTE